MQVVNLHKVRIERRGLYSDFSSSCEWKNLWSVVVCKLCRSTRDGDRDMFGFVKIDRINWFCRIIKSQSEIFCKCFSGNTLEVSAAPEWRCCDNTISDD